MSKLIVASGATAILVLALAGCSAGNSPAGSSSSGTEGSSSTSSSEEVANPWVDCATLADAAGVSGVELTAPDAVDGYDGRAIQATQDGMTQVVYGDAEDDSSPLLYVRKAAGEGQDISGDYEEYAENSSLDAGGIQVSVRGEGTLWHDAIWSKDGCSFSIYATDGIDDATVVSLVTQVG